MSFGFIENNCIKLNGGISKTDEDCVGSDGLRRGKTNGNSVELYNEQVKTNVNCFKPEGGKIKTSGNSVEPDDEQVKTYARGWEGQDQ